MEDRTNVPAISTTNAVNITGMPSTHEMMAYQTYAKTAVDSQMYRGVGKEAGVMMIMLAAREFGIGPAQALNGGINIIEGKVELSARMMQAMIRRGKHIIKILETTNERCRIYGKRADTGEEYIAEFTIQQAQAAGLIKEKGAWKKTPDDMLFARTMSKLARRLFSDVIGIGYVQGEISTCYAHEEALQEVIQEIPDISEQELLQDLLESIPQEDRNLMLQFLEQVKDHYKWDKIKTLKEFLVDISKTITRFHDWKNKIEK